ncbi:MAG TPA: restriction endonuclease [Opitutaceae bacterium]
MSCATAFLEKEAFGLAPIAEQCVFDRLMDSGELQRERSALREAIHAAQSSVWVRAAGPVLRVTETSDLLKGLRSSLDLRCLLEQPGFGPDGPKGYDSDLDPFPGMDVFSVQEAFPDPDAASSFDWAYRWIPGIAQGISIIVDAKREYLLRAEGRTFFLAHNRVYSTALRKEFEIAWLGAIQVGPIYEECDDIQDDAETAPEGTVITASQWKRILDELHRNPDELLRMSPRRLEELVAELFAKDGFEVKLTPYSKDGGIDIYAARSGLVKELYLVQCKQSAKRRRVSIDVVRSLYGVVNRDGATAGLIVTTSHLTRGARSECEQLKHRMGFREYEDLVGWIRRIVRK